MVTSIKNIEELFLKIFKVTVLFIMGMALLAVIGLVSTALYQFSQSPKEPPPARKAPVREIKLEDLKRYLIEKDRSDSGKGNSIRQSPVGRPTSLRFLEQATVLYRCAGEFGKRVGADIEDASDAVNAQRLESLRSYIERLANGSSLRGDPWVKAVANFGCTALADDSLVQLKRDGRVKSVFYPLIEFHVGAWDAIQSERVRFEQSERDRVAAQRAAEAFRVAKAKAFALTCMTAAAIAFGVFMALAIYLLAAKIENNLREINESIRTRGLQERP